MNDKTKRLIQELEGHLRLLQDCLQDLVKENKLLYEQNEFLKFEVELFRKAWEDSEGLLPDPEAGPDT